MSEKVKHITLDDLDLPGIGGEQKESVLGLIRQICSDVLLIGHKRFEVGVAMARLHNIAGHGSFEPLRKRFFPQVPRRSAQRWTAVGREFGSYREYVLDIGFSYLGKLAEQEVLGPIKSELMDQIRRGEKADGSYYRAKIAELLREEDEIDEFRDKPVKNQDARSEENKRDTERNDDARNTKFDNEFRDVVDRSIPTDPVQLQALWNVLSTTKEKRVIFEYIYQRVSDLVRHTTMKDIIEVEDMQKFDLSSASQ